MAPARPLMGSSNGAAENSEHAVEAAAGDAGQGPELTGVSGRKGPKLTGVSDRKGPDLTGVPDRKGPDLTGVSPKTPAQTPAPNARTGREPLNPKTWPPNPPDGGSRPASIQVVEDYITDRGRKRKRTVTVDLTTVHAQLAPPGEADLDAWRRLTVTLERIVGPDRFGVWCSQLALLAVGSDGALVLSYPPPVRAWFCKRFERAVAAAASSAGRCYRLADEIEIQALDGVTAFPAAPTEPEAGCALPDPIPQQRQEAS